MSVNMTTFDGIPFTILADRGGFAMTDWTITPVTVKEHIPYSNITVVERIGFEPARASWRLLFASHTDYFALAARIGTTGTLTVPGGLQSLKGTQYPTGQPGTVWDVLDGVTLDALSEPTRYRDGRVSVEATFERPVDPVTRTAVFS